MLDGTAAIMGVDIATQKPLYTSSLSESTFLLGSLLLGEYDYLLSGITKNYGSSGMLFKGTQSTGRVSSSLFTKATNEDVLQSYFQ